MKKVVILGGGGHAKVVIELLRGMGEWAIVGCLDPRASTPIAGIPILGGDKLLPELSREGIRHACIAVGDNRIRTRLGSEAARHHFEWVTATGRNVTISPLATVGAGTVVMEGAVINADAQIGELAVINTGAIVEHDCHVGAGTHVAPGAILTGGVTLGSLAFVGAGATILPGLTVGAEAIIGAGAVVIRNVPAGETHAGIPAKQLSRGDRS